MSTGVSFLDPSTGLLDDIDLTIKSLRTGVFKKPDDPSRAWPVIIATFVTANGKEVTENYFAGTLDKLRPSDDGLRFLPNSEGGKISDMQPAYKLIASILNAVRGMEDTKAAEKVIAAMTAAPDQVNHFDGFNVHVNRVSEKARTEGGKAQSYSLVSRINSVGGGASAATPAAAKAGKTGGAAAAAKAKAAAPAAEAGTTSAAGGPVEDSVIDGLLVEALRKNGGSIARAKVPTEVYTLAKAQGLDWKAVMKRTNDEAYLTRVGGEPLEIGDTVVIVSYDGTTVTLSE